MSTIDYKVLYKFDNGKVRAEVFYLSTGEHEILLNKKFQTLSLASRGVQSVIAKHSKDRV